MKKIIYGLALALALEAQPLLAAESALPLIDGQVQKVDKETKRMTIRHGPLPNLDMPAMTMVFSVDKDALLDGVQAGDKITFTVDKIRGAYTVMSLEPDPHAGHH